MASRFVEFIGKPRTSVTDSFVERVEALIIEDPTITLSFLALELGVSYGIRSAQTIIHNLAWTCQEVCKMGPSPVDSPGKRKRGGNLEKWSHEFDPNGPPPQVFSDECWISFFAMKYKH